MADLGLDEFSELPPPTTDSDAEIDALVGGMAPGLDEVAALESIPAEPLADEEDDSIDESKLRPEPLWTPANWEQDRPAAVHLAEQDGLEACLARAAWLETEASHTEDAGAKARALLVASELVAMGGDAKRARALANQALALAPTAPLMQRQARLLAALDDDHKAVLAALDTEAKSSANPAVRSHAVYLGAEIARAGLHDTAQADRRLDVLFKLDPSDPRQPLMKLARVLAANDKPPAAPPGLDGDLAVVARAVVDLASLRKDSPPTAESPIGAVHFMRARRALARCGERRETGHSHRAGESVAELATLSGLELGARWLAASLLATDSSTRPKAIALLRQIIEDTDSPAARRALAARSLEQGDPSGLASLLEGHEADSADLTAADRTSLAALTGAPSTLVDRWLARIETDPRLTPLTAAAASATRPPDAPLGPACGSEAKRAGLALGRALVASQAEGAEPGLLRSTLEAYAVAREDDPLVSVLEGELALSAGAAGRVAHSIAATAGAEGPSGERDKHLAAGLLLEIGRDADSAARQWASALGADPGAEPPARALMAAATPSGAADLLVGLADAVSDEPRKALLLVEAALRVGMASEDFPALLDRAIESAPGLPFAHRLGKQQARQRGDAEALLGRLRRRRAASDDPIESALDAIREALLIADTEREAAATLLETASGARPTDVALHELAERLSPAGGSSRGAWREAVAASAEGPTRVRLLLEAALEYERADDLAAAARVADAAASTDGSDFARITAERLAAHGAGGAALAERLIAAAKVATDPHAQRELYDRLSELDRTRGDKSSALLWQNAILETNPKSLKALRALEHAYIGEGRVDELEPIATTLAELLDRNEANAHAMLAARLCSKQDTAKIRQLAERALAHAPPSLWALRTLSVVARDPKDDELALRVDKELSERVARAIDSATLALRAGEAAMRLGRLDDARGLLDRAVELVPDHPVALARQAEALEGLGDAKGAAQALEALASASKVQAHQVDAWHRAGCLWLDAVGDEDRGRAALETVADLDLTHGDTFARLSALYVKQDAREKLADLLERRIALTTDPEERVALEVTRGKALADIGDTSAAREALAAALDANPDHADALDAFAELSVHDGDWEGAEQAWIRLARHSTEPERQAEIYRKLGALYEKELPNAQRAELSYREVLKRLPNDVGAMERLVQVHGGLGDTQKALEIQTELLNRAGTPEEKRDRTIELSRVQEDFVKDRRKAEATLDKARKTWPQDGAVLRALAEFYRRGDETTALNVLLDRAANDARRALGTGRFDAALFEALATVAELRGGTDAARVANATLAALTGADASIPGAGLAAADARLDDLLAPELLSLPLRALLKKVGDALDGAYPMDLRSIRATPLPAEASGFAQQIQQMATAFGIHNVEAYVSTAIGPSCIPASAAPPRLVFGSVLLEKGIDETARTFLVLRSLKLLQARAATLSRTAPIDLWPVVAGMLTVFAPTWQAPGVEPKKVAEHQQRIKGALVRQLDDDVPVLAMEVIGSIGNRASQLGTAVNQWGNRTALLAMGSPAAALIGIAAGTGHPEGPPADAAERLKWIVRNPEARDLAVFSVSEQYSDARRRLGLG